MTKKKKTANDNGITAAGLPTVGYGKPPMHSQFQKGKSGNPKGRPKGSPNLGSLLQATFDHKLTTTVNGKLTKMPLIQALITKLVAMAMNGNHGAMKMALDLYNVAHPPGNDNQPLTAGSSFQLTPEELAAIDKSTLLKGIK